MPSGVVSSYILFRGFKRIGADVSVRIPDRIRDGYGLNERLVKEAIDDGCEVLVTCDNGISAFSQVEMAKAAGMRVIVTDHHEIPYENINGERHWLLPPADAVVNPHQENCGYPFKDICGAVVAWKLISVLYEKAGIDRHEALDMIEYAAFATIGDVMDLIDENRIIVKEGLKAMRHTKSAALRKLALKAGINIEDISSFHIGFVLGPCINACGRLKNAERALEFLLCEDESKAESLAEELTELNSRRKDMTEAGVNEAVALIESTDIGNDKVLAVFLPDCHESIAGIIAGRLRERYGKPVFVFTKSEQGIKGSGRSIDEYSMYDELTKVKELMTKFGGHPLAAGLSLADDSVEPFRKRINEVCTLTDEQLEQKVSLDMQLPLYYVNEELIREFDRLQPFGKGNEAPVFAEKDLTVIRPSIIGKNRNAVKMTLKSSDGRFMEGIYFGDPAGFMEGFENGGKLMIAYYPSINEFRGSRTIQAVIKDFMFV